MAAELILALIGVTGAAGGGGWWAWNRSALRQHVNRVRTGWVRAGQIVRWGPVQAYCASPQARRGVAGAVGVTGGRLVFDGQRANRCDAGIPLDALRWLGLSAAGRRQRALHVHYEDAQGWHVVVFLMTEPLALANVLSTEGDLPLHDARNHTPDFGPARATRMQQDVYGEWAAERDGDLYLAPDRLLFDWRDAVLLAHVQRLDAMRDAARRNPMGVGLLRVEVQLPGAPFEVIGFLVRQPERWAAAIQARIETPIPVQAGRKKKST